MADKMDQAIAGDGSLYFCGNWYLHWSRGDNDATLDGAFTAQELRKIADHMEAHREEEKGGT